MEWFFLIAIGWLAAGLLVARWVGVASGPARGSMWNPPTPDEDPSETAKLVEDALHDFYGGPGPESQAKADRGTSRGW